jgi:hypothetical protein
MPPTKERQAMAEFIPTHERMLAERVLIGLMGHPIAYEAARDRPEYLVEAAFKVARAFLQKSEPEIYQND